MTAIRQLKGAPVALTGAVQVGVRLAGEEKAPFVPGQEESHDQERVCPNESAAWALRAITPPEATGFGVPDGPEVKVTVWGTTVTFASRVVDPPGP